MIYLKINHLPKTPNQLLRKHWAIISQEAKKWHMLVRFSLGFNIPETPYEKIKLELIRHSSHEPDFDGLCGSFKYVVDGLVKAKLIKDDKPSNIVQCEYKWQKSKIADQHIEVKIEVID